METRLKNIVNIAEGLKPIMTFNGKEVYSIEDDRKVSQVKLEERKHYPDIYFGERSLNANGQTYARSRVTHVGVNPETFFLNRARVDMKKKVYEVVTDYRAIQDIAKGYIYTPKVFVHVLKAVNGKLELQETRLIRDDEFIREFDNELDQESMLIVFDALKQQKNHAVSKTKISV